MALIWPTAVGVTMIVAWRVLVAGRSPAHEQVRLPPLGALQMPPPFAVAETNVVGVGRTNVITAFVAFELLALKTLTVYVTLPAASVRGSGVSKTESCRSMSALTVVDCDAVLLALLGSG